MLARIKDGKIETPKIVGNVYNGDGRVIYNPRKEHLLQLGFKEYIAETPAEAPRDGYVWNHQWVIEDGEIVALWHQVRVDEDELV
jgi:hypothetical protein